MKTLMKALCAAVASLVLAVASYAPANATLIGFQINNGGTAVATGFFDYSSANPVISFPDLTDFSITIGAYTYDLPFVNGHDPSQNFMQFDTATNTFLTGAPAGFYGLVLSLASSDFTDGFLFVVASDNSEQYYTYNGGQTDDQSHQPWTTICVIGVSCPGAAPESVVPEPATLGVLGVGLLAAGAFGRRRAKKAKS